MVVIKAAHGTRAVSSDSQLASKAALEILEEGGNAFDAAIAASAVLSVVLPHAGGPGGDGFMLAFVGDEVAAYASSGRSPSGFRADEYLRRLPKRGPLTVTVPGLVNLWGFLSEEFCRLPLERLLRPATSLAYNGFYASYYLARASELSEGELGEYRWSRYYRGVRPGAYISNKEMARTLRILATRGWDEFYYGRLAERFVEELNEQGVDIGLDDMMDHEGYEAKPLRMAIDGRELYELPPNTQGVTTLHMISAIHELDLRSSAFDDPRRVEAWAEVVEVAYGFRDSFLGDPDYMEVDVSYYLEYGKARELLLSRGTSGGSGYGSGDTTFLVVSDSEAVVGLIQSLFHPFGSGLMALGFPVQNRGYGFAKKGGLPNSPAPGKRPLHTLSVLGIDDGKRRYVIGCAGGDMRPQIHARIYENIFVYGLDLPRALDAPRFIFVEYSGKKRVVVESRYKSVKPGDLTVDLVEWYGPTGLVHAAAVDVPRRVAEVAADPRSEGTALALP